MIYAHGEELTGWGRGNKYKAMCFALRHADRVIANSDFTRDTLVGMGVRPERIVLHAQAPVERGNGSARACPRTTCARAWVWAIRHG